MSKKACRYCGAETSKGVWTRGTKRVFRPICDAQRCWTKYWKEVDQTTKG